MEDDNVDIYDDINDFDLGNEVEKLKDENETLREQIRSLKGDVAKLTSTIDDLKENEETLKKNISTLYLTAKAEIDRKDRMISELRTEKDDICFRRFNKPENKRERKDNFSESNIAKKFKYNCNKVSTSNEPNNQHELEIVDVIEIKDDDSINNIPGTPKHEVCELKKEQFDDTHHEGYKPRSRRSAEKEDIAVSKYQTDNKRRREEFGDRYHDKNRSSSRPGKRYNNEHVSRSKSRERNASREDRYNHKDNFNFRGERTTVFGDRVNWPDKRDTRREHDNRNSGSRYSRGDYSRTFDRTGTIKRETPSWYQKDEKRDDNYEKTKLDVKLEKNNSKLTPDLTGSRKNSLSESILRHPTERAMSENENITKIKPEKKRLKMLDKVEKKIRELRTTPIKIESRPAERARTLIDDSLKEASRNITQEFDNGRSKKISKKFTPEWSRIEDSKNKTSNQVISPCSKMEVNVSDDDYIDTLSDDQYLFILDESSNWSSEKNEKKEAEEKSDVLSDISDDELTKAAIQDIQLTVKYHTDRVIPFQLSNDLPDSTNQADLKDEKNNFPHPKQNQNTDAINSVSLDTNVIEKEKRINQDLNVNMGLGNLASNGDTEIVENDKSSSRKDLPIDSCQGQILAVEDHKVEKPKNDTQLKQYKCSIILSGNVNLAAENTAENKEIFAEKINSPLQANKEWKDVKLDEIQNININSDAVKSDHKHIENTKEKDKKIENKKRINILSDIIVTPPVKKKIKLIREEPAEEEIKVLNFDAGNYVAYKEKELETKVESSPRKNLQDVIKETEDKKKELKTKLNMSSHENLSDTEKDVKQTVEKDKINVNLDVSYSAKDEKMETKKPHRSLLKEFITKHAKKNSKLATENQKEEGENIKLSKQDSTCIKVPLYNPETADENIATKEKMKILQKKDSASTTQDKTVENLNDKKGVSRFKKQDIIVNEKKEAAKKTQHPSLPNIIIEEENTAKNSKDQDTKIGKKVTKKITTCLSKEYEETKNQNKSDNNFNKKDGVNKIMASNIDFDSKNSTRDKKKESNKKIESPSHKDISVGTKQEVNVGGIITEKKSKEPTIDNTCIGEETGNVGKLSKKRSNSTSSRNSSNTNLAKDKKEIRKNSVAKENSSNSPKQSKTLEVKGNIKDLNTDVSQCKKQMIHPFELSLNPELYADNSAKNEEKKIKGSTKKSLTNATKQNIAKEKIQNTQDKNDIRSESQDKVIEKKKSPPKECLSSVKGDITKENKDIKEHKRQTGNKTKESSNVRLVARNPVNDHKNIKQSSKHKMKNSPVASLDQENKDWETGIQDSPIDLSRTDKQDMGENKCSKMQNVNKELSKTNLEVENTTKDVKRRSASEADFVKPSKDTDDSIKGFKESTHSTQLGFKEIEECSKESIQKLMEGEDKACNDQLKRKVTEKCVDIPDKSKKDRKDERNSLKYQKAKHTKKDQTCSGSDNIHVEKESEEVSKMDAELPNSDEKDKASQAIGKQSNELIIPNSEEDIKKNKEDSKESTDTASSGETVDSKIMKFSDMKNILRGSIEEPPRYGTSAEINVKKIKGVKKESPTIQLDNKCSTKESKKTDLVISKNKKPRGSDCVEKSEGDTSNNSTSTCKVERQQTGNAKSIHEKLYALIGSYSDDSDLANSSENVNNNMDSNNTVQTTNDNKICEVSTGQQTKDNCDKIENKNASIFDPPATNNQAVSKDSLLNNQTSVLKNTENSSPAKPQARRRITPTPVKANKSVCNFENILGKTSQSIYAQASPLHLTHEGEIPVLHLEEYHINNLPTEIDINNKNIITLLDTMNISNMECDIPKITCETTANSEANSGDSHLNVSPIKGGKSLTFENVISKVTSTPVPNKCQNEKNGISNSNGSENIVGGVTSDATLVRDGLIANKSLSTVVQSSATIRRKRRRCRIVIID